MWKLLGAQKDMAQDVDFPLVVLLSVPPTVPNRHRARNTVSLACRLVYSLTPPNVVAAAAVVLVVLEDEDALSQLSFQFHSILTTAREVNRQVFSFPFN